MHNIYVIHLKYFIFTFNNVLLFIYMYIFVIFGSPVTTLGVQLGIVTDVLYVDFQLVNVVLLVSALLYLYLWMSYSLQCKM
jgi:hypothetical protein